MFLLAQQRSSARSAVVAGEGYVTIWSVDVSGRRGSDAGPCDMVTPADTSINTAAV